MSEILNNKGEGKYILPTYNIIKYVKIQVNHRLSIKLKYILG